MHPSGACVGGAGGAHWGSSHVIPVASVLSLVLSIPLMAASAEAGSTITGGDWGPAQDVSSKSGRFVTLSRDGRVAAWIGTAERGGRGSGRTAWYRGAKRGWSASAAIPGMKAVSTLRASSTGRYVFGESRTGSPEVTRVLVAERKKRNKWGKARTVAEGRRLRNAMMSENARTVVWVDWSGSDYSPTDPPVPILSRDRVGNEWSPPTVVAEVLRPRRVVLSGDGSTLVWADGAGGLGAAHKHKDGRWGAPSIIKQYASDEGLVVDRLGLDWTGSTLVWLVNQLPMGVRFAKRTVDGWTPPDYATEEWVHDVAVSPNGRTLAYSTANEKMTVASWNGAKWRKSNAVGPRRPTSWARIDLTNNTLAWLRGGSGGSSLWTAINQRGEWAKATRLTPNASGPFLSLDGHTLAWISTKEKRIVSSKR